MPLIVVYYERWSGRLAQRLTLNASIHAPPIIADKPTARDTRPRPYLFLGFRRVPQRGWNLQGVDQDERKKTPAPRWIPVRQWTRWRPQPWLGWQQDDTVASEAPPPPFVLQFTRFPFGQRYMRQPQLGFAASVGESQEARVPPPMVATARRSTMFLTRYAITPYTSSVPPSDGGITPPAGGTERNERRRWLWHRSSTP